MDLDLPDEKAKPPPPVPRPIQGKGKGKANEATSDEPAVPTGSMGPDDPGWGEDARIRAQGVRLGVREAKLDDFVKVVKELLGVFFPAFKTHFKASSSSQRQHTQTERHLAQEHRFDVQLIDNMMEVFFDATLRLIKAYVEAFEDGTPARSVFPPASRVADTDAAPVEVSSEAGVQDHLKRVHQYACDIFRTLRFASPTVGVQDWVSIECDIGTAPVGFKGCLTTLESRFRAMSLPIISAYEATEEEKKGDRERAVLSLAPEAQRLVRATDQAARRTVEGGSGRPLGTAEIQRQVAGDASNSETWTEHQEECVEGYEARWKNESRVGLLSPPHPCPTEEARAAHPHFFPSQAGASPGSQPSAAAPASALLGHVGTGVAPVIARSASGSRRKRALDGDLLDEGEQPPRRRLRSNSATTSTVADPEAQGPPKRSIAPLFIQAALQAIAHSAAAFYLANGFQYYFGIREPKHVYSSRLIKPMPRRHGVQFPDPPLTLMLGMVGWVALTAEFKLWEADAFNSSTAPGPADDGAGSSEVDQREDDADEDTDGGGESNDDGGAGGGGPSHPSREAGGGDGGGRSSSSGGEGGAGRGSIGREIRGLPVRQSGSAPAAGAQLAPSITPDALLRSIVMKGAYWWIQYSILDTPFPALFVPDPAFDFDTKNPNPSARTEPFTLQTPGTMKTAAIATSSTSSASTPSAGSRSAASSRSTASLRDGPTADGDDEAQEVLPVVRGYELLSSSLEHAVYTAELCHGRQRTPVGVPAIAKVYGRGSRRRLAEFSAYDKLKNLKGLPVVYGALVNEEDDEALLVLSAEGTDLASLGDAPLSADQIEAFGNVLDSFHQRGVAHRDLSPHNLLIRPDGSVCIVDFDFSGLQSDAGSEEFDRWKELDREALKSALWRD